MSCLADELEPPWARYPWIPLGSIGWRMGNGEGYQIQWGNWAEAITSVDAAITYLHRHPPAPPTWIRWIASWLAELAGDPEEDGGASPVWQQRTLDEELVADDAAYPVFVRNLTRSGGMAPPWAWPRSPGTPHAALRYYGREVGWWARWLATECGDRAAHVAAHAAVPEGWERIAEAARTGAFPGGTGAEAMVATLAATGTLPPPWQAGLEPLHEIHYDEDDSDDRDRWLWWIGDTFEDEPSWDAYLARWSPMPATWKQALADELYALPFGHGDDEE